MTVSGLQTQQTEVMVSQALNGVLPLSHGLSTLHIT